VWGTIANLAGATLGATAAFLVARYVAADWVRQKAGARLDRLIKGVEAEGWRFVAFTRLVPLFPFNLLNYVLGLTRIPLAQYAVATFVFMLPGAIVYTYLGYAGREALSGGEGLLEKGLVGLSLLAALAFVPRLVARLRERPMLEVDELRRRIASRADLMVLDVRTAEDFVGEQGHITGAVNIPLEVLEARIELLGDDPERPIAIVCRTDRRSAKAAGLLARRGFVDARVVQGGMTAWHAAGWPVAR
jgi:rhodanese-related sulfurtransferase